MPYPAIGIYTQKNEKNQWCFFRFCCVRGGQGDMPHASQFTQVSTWKKLGKMVPVDVHRQCLLCFCKLSEGSLRVLAA